MPVLRNFNPIDSRDRELVQIVDAAMVEAARKSGAWLVCRPGCNECCLGPFAISRLDARRLRRGLDALHQTDPGRAARVVSRAQATAKGLADDEPCPALDPETGTCDLYEVRPLTCRTFGPPVRCGPEALGVCELCFVGASESDIAACEVEIDPGGLESALLEELERSTGQHGETTVAAALAEIKLPG